MKARERAPLTLSRRIVLFVLTVTSIAVVLASALLIRLQESIFRTDLERRSEAIARSVAEYSVGPLAFEDHDGADEILRGLTSSALVRSAAIYDASGRLFAENRERSAPPPPESAPPRSGIDSAREEGLVVVVPIGYAGSHDGTLRLLVSTSSLDRARRELMITMTLVVLGLLVASALLATWLRRFVTSPLLVLADRMESIASDTRYDTRVAANRQDEIGVLQSVFSSLLGRLTERERERDSSEASLRALVAALPDTVVLLDSTGRIVATPIPRSIGPIDGGSLVGRDLAEVLPTAAAQAVRTAAREALADGEVRTIECELGSEDEPKSFDVVASPLPETDVSGARVVVLFRDVTERKAIEDRAQQAEKLQAIGQLAGGIAHDFNNLLAVILTNASLVDQVSPAKAGVLLNDLRGAAHRATDLVAQILAFARRRSSVRVRTDVDELVARVVRIVSRTVDPRIRLRTQIESLDCFVDADVAQLESALINLAVNARDAMPEGGDIIFQVRTIAAEGDHGESIEIAVTDTGTGIPKDVLPRIFEPFFTTKPVGSGTGLGLSAVYGTVQNLSGTIHVESELGHGTTFRIRLPRSELPPTAAEIAVTDTRKPVRSGHILFVEDDPSVRESTRFALEHMGFSVSAFESGLDALREVGERPGYFEVALIDNVMPEITGRELMTRLRMQEDGLPILLCSGGDIDNDAATGAARPDDFLAKPYSLDALARRLTDLVEARRRQQGDHSPSVDA